MIMTIQFCFLAVHITGHKNPSSLNNYRKLRDEQKQKMAKILASTDKNPMTPTMNDASHTEIANSPSVAAESCKDTNTESVCLPAPPSSTQMQDPCADSLSVNFNNISNTINPSDIFQGIFHKTTITGGNFAINFNFCSHSVKKKKVYSYADKIVL